MTYPLPNYIISHARKVCSLYKRALRNYESWLPYYTDYRYEAILLRERFEKNKNIRDMRVAKKLLEDGEEELWRKKHPNPIIFPDSPEGCAYEREQPIPDWVLDHWHPEEKAMYPKYFALREKRKKEYIEFYNKQYPDAPKHFEEDH